MVKVCGLCGTTIGGNPATAEDFEISHGKFEVELDELDELEICQSCCDKRSSDLEES